MHSVGPFPESAPLLLSCPSTICPQTVAGGHLLGQTHCSKPSCAFQTRSPPVSVTTKVFTVVSVSGRSSPLPPLLSPLASSTLAVAQIYQADPCLKAPVLPVLSAWSPFPLGTTWGARHTFRCGFHRVSFSVRLSCQVSMLKTTVNVSSASLTV